MFDVPPEHVTPQEEVVAERLAECGLSRDQFTVTYQDYLQSDEIVIRQGADVSEANFECIHDAVGYSVLHFEDAELQIAYSDHMFGVIRPQLVAEAEIRLREMGLLDGFPRQADHDGQTDYVRALEAHAGLEPGEWLVHSEDIVMLRPERILRDSRETYATLSPLIAVLRYASLVDDLPFGFVGNERYQATDD